MAPKKEDYDYDDDDDEKPIGTKKMNHKSNVKNQSPSTTSTKSKSIDNTKKKERSKKEEQQQEQEPAKKRQKKVYDLPGQKRDPPEERDPLRIFYETLYKQKPTSELAALWMMESGLLPLDVATKVYDKKINKSKTQRGAVTSPAKPVRTPKEKLQATSRNSSAKNKTNAGNVSDSASKQLKNKKKKPKDESEEEEEESSSDEESEEEFAPVTQKSGKKAKASAK